MKEGEMEKRAKMEGRGRKRKEGSGNGISNILTPRRLRGGVKIRVSEFLGGGETPQIIEISPPPADSGK